MGCGSRTRLYRVTPYPGCLLIPALRRSLRNASTDKCQPLVGESANERSSDRRVNMSKLSRYCFLLAIAACLLLAQPVTAAAEEGVRGNLVDVNWLAKHLKNPDV